MNRMKRFCCMSNVNETAKEIFSLGAPFPCHVVKKHLYGIFDPTKPCIRHSIGAQRYFHQQLPQQECLGYGGMSSPESLMSGRNLFRRSNLPCSFRGNPLRSMQSGSTFCHYGDIANNETSLSRKFLAQLWVADRKMRKDLEKRRRKGKQLNYDEAREPFQHPSENSFTGRIVTEEESAYQAAPVLKQQPVSQSVSGFLKPTSPEEFLFMVAIFRGFDTYTLKKLYDVCCCHIIQAQIAHLLARSNLLITRDIEWANLVLGFEQVVLVFPITWFLYNRN
ncbi:hypothetical protein Golob_014670 [Gossypium lobatum]|uniref:Uncharacterized protein n=1 Tax=Gossypium lobatum TaxID=34289 RepID=A0A7J8LYT6_9ROSI|nr:hypothetical protein [Gossypium lobatum]